jgi:hypothetical protein
MASSFCWGPFFGVSPSLTSDHCRFTPSGSLLTFRNVEFLEFAGRQDAGGLSYHFRAHLCDRWR